MNQEQLLQAFDGIRVWQQGDRRAVHKPLLVLLALAKLIGNDEEALSWPGIEGQFKQLLEEFGPRNAASSRHYPFWHLRTDGLWHLAGPAELLARPARSTPNLGEMRRGKLVGAFSPEIIHALKAHPEWASLVAKRILSAHFPESIHDDVQNALGLTLEGVGGGTSKEGARRRDPAFRERVLMAYQYKCSVCGHDLRLGRQTIGLEAAHIKWFQARGPDIVPNGLALCSLHHKVFDLGAFTIRPDTYEMMFSQQLNGSDQAAARMLAYQGVGIILPQATEYYPKPEFLHWHEQQVFKQPARV